MEKSSFLEKLKDLMVELQLDELKKLVEEALKKGFSPKEVIGKLSEGMRIVGEKYEKNEYFLTELIVCGEIMKEAMEIIKPYIETSSPIEYKGTIVIGTVKGDIHDIGKNIVASFLSAAGFKVYDLGVDVPAEKFIEKAKVHNADILAMSALYTLFMPYMKTVIEELEKINLRKKLKIIVGGAPLTPEFAKEIGADAYGKDATEAVKVCEQLIREKS